MVESLGLYEEAAHPEAKRHDLVIIARMIK